jgi:PAS domain-containing protein
VDNVNVYIELIGILVAVGTFLSGFLYGMYLFARRIRRSIPLSDRLHDLFGTSPIDELHKILWESRFSISELEIRQRIAEKHLEIGIYACRPDGTCEWANDYLCDTFGLDSKEMKGFGWLSAISRDDRERVYETWMYSVQHGIPYDESYTIESSHNPPLRVHTKAWPIKHPTTDAIVFFIGYVRIM